MVNAQEAKRRAEEVIKKRQTEELKKIDTLIETAIKKGQKEVSCGRISKYAKTELEKLGYVVKTGSQYNEEWVDIEFY